MTLAEFQYQMDIKREMEFSFHGIKFNLIHGKDSDGKEYIKFGPLYEEVKYYSFGELMNKAMVDNAYLKNFIEDL